MSVENKVDTVNTLLFEMQDGFLALPDLAVAEIVDYQVPEREGDDVADWFLGMLNWRDTNVALISFDQLNLEQSQALGERAKIVVVNAVSQRQKFAYWAFVINHMPKMQNIAEQGLGIDESVELTNFVAAQAIYQDESIIIPHMENIEAQIVQAMPG